MMKLLPKPKPKPFLSPTFPLICLFLILLSCFSSSTLADDTSTMQKLAASLSGTPNGWSNDKNPCTWSGIKCDSSNRVTSINLSKQRLSGTLPSDLTQLSSLQSFNVQQNTISGPLPLFSNLTNLQQLLLNDNNFTSVPSSSTFMGLSALQTLNLGNNPSLDPWFFPQDLTQSNTLTAFTANNVNLMGTIPDIFDKFPSLQSLRLSYNNLTGSLPPSFGVTGIQNLWLNNQLTGLSGTLDVLSKMNQLTQVWLQKNDFTGPIPDLSNCTSLFDLQLRDNQLTGLVPPSLTTLASLLNLTLSNNKLQGPLPTFGSRVKLILTPTNNFCTTQPGVPCDPQVMTLLEIAAALGYPFNLANSWLGNNACQQWTYVTCDSQQKNVTVVNFSKQNFLGTISPAFSKLASLRSLLLDHNHLTGPIPDSLTHLTQLKMLDVSNNNLSGKVPDFPPGVTLNTVDNPLLGKELPSGGNSGGDGNTDSDPKSLGKKPTSVSVALIVGIVIAVVVFICILLWVFYKSYTKKHPEKFGRVSKDTQNGKGMTTNTSVAGSNMNAYGGVPNELNSQSSGEHSDVQFFEGGNVAISFQVLRQVTNNFSEDNILGRGGFGVVYKGELHDGTQIAVKRMESGVMGTKGLKEFQAEIAVLTKVRHRHLVALLGFCTNGNERLLVYEYMPQGTLSQHLFEWRELGCNPLTWKQRVSIALDVARGIEYLHSLAQQSFIHRDLKPSNILLGDDMRAKVADFGLVKNAPDGKYSVETKLAGTFGYLAPEYAVTGRVTTKVDVYAFGVVLMELLTGRKALDEALPDEMSHLVSWFRRVLTSKKDMIKSIDPTLDPDEETFEIICRVAELAGHCTSREPSQRPDMGHAVNILGPLVEQWKPTTEDLDDSFGIDFHVSLPQALQRWQANEGTSTMAEGLHHGRTTSISDTQSSIPTKPGSFADTMDSMDCR